MPNRLLSKLVFGCIGGILLLGSAVRGQTAAPAPAKTAGQIGPNTAGSISPAQGVAPAGGSVVTKNILAGALTPQTRQTLQEAMDSDSAADPGNGREVTLGPGEAAQLDGTTADKVAFGSLPPAVRTALRDTTRDTLRTPAGR